MFFRQQAPDLTKRNKRWWRFIGCVLSTLLTRSSNSEDSTRAGYDESFRSSFIHFTGPAPDEGASSPPASLVCDDNTPIETGWVFESAGETFVRYFIETLSASDGSQIPAPPNPIILQSPSVTGQCLGFHRSRLRKCTQPLHHPSNLLPHDLQQTHTPRPHSSFLTFQCQTHSPFLPTPRLGGILYVIQETVCPTPSYLEAAARTMDTVENPVQTVSYPQRTDPFVINTSPPPVAILYDSFRVTDVSAAESVSKIWSFMHSPSQVAAARNLRGEEAQALIDLIDQVSDMRFQHDGVRGTERGCRPSGYQNWSETFGSNACTYFTKSAKLANYCQPHVFYGKSSCMSVRFAIAVDSRTSAKESIWDAAWPSNTSGSGRRMRSTRFSRYKS